MAKAIKMNSNLEVKKSDVIVKARYTLSPLAIKFISAIISSLRYDDAPNQEYVFRVKDFQELGGYKTKQIYSLVDEALNNLLKNPLTIYLNDEDNSVLKVNWISSAVYNNGSVSFYIDPRLKPYLLEAKEKFLKYKLENILKLRSGYSIRIYEIFKDIYNLNKRYGSFAKTTMSISELRDVLSIPVSYQYSTHIKNRVLKKAKEELSNFTDITFSFNEIKKGKRVVSLEITIKPNKSNEAEKTKRDTRYLKSVRNFVEHIRDKYAGTSKSFFASKDSKFDHEVFYAVDMRELLYGYSSDKTKLLDYNAYESMERYSVVYEIVKCSETLQTIIEEGKDLYEVYKNNRQLFKVIVNEISFYNDKVKKESDDE